MKKKILHDSYNYVSGRKKISNGAWLEMIDVGDSFQNFGI